MIMKPKSGDILKYNEKVCLEHSYIGNFYFRVVSADDNSLYLKCILIENEANIKRDEFKRFLKKAFMIYLDHYHDSFIMSSQHELDKIRIFQ